MEKIFKDLCIYYINNNQEGIKKTEEELKDKFPD